METILEVKNLKKEFNDGSLKTRAIQDINFEVKKGEFVSIVGPSGCGKTTLLRCITGLLDSFSGQIIKRGRATLVFQDYNRSLFNWKKVKSNILFNYQGNNYNKALNYYLKITNLEGFENHYPYELSGGMQQKVAIARALAYNPDIILMDEPFGSLDALTRNYLENKLLEIWRKMKKTIIFITHDIEEAIYLSDRVIVLSKRPAQVIAEQEINLDRPRDQLITKENKKFISYRHEIFSFLQNNKYEKK